MTPKLSSVNSRIAVCSNDASISLRVPSNPDHLQLPFHDGMNRSRPSNTRTHPSLSILSGRTPPPIPCRSMSAIENNERLYSMSASSHYYTLSQKKRGTHFDRPSGYLTPSETRHTHSTHSLMFDRRDRRDRHVFVHPRTPASFPQGAVGRRGGQSAEPSVWKCMPTRSPDGWRSAH